jgi:hypothetical protein
MAVWLLLYQRKFSARRRYTTGYVFLFIPSIRLRHFGDDSLRKTIAPMRPACFDWLSFFARRVLRVTEALGPVRLLSASAGELATAELLQTTVVPHQWNSMLNKSCFSVFLKGKW